MIKFFATLAMSMTIVMTASAHKSWPTDMGKLPKFPMVMVSNLSAMPSWPEPLISWPSTPIYPGN